MNQFLIVLLLLSLFSCTAEKGPTKPNVVIIFTDDQGYEDLGCFGSPDIRTPHIDAMAARGLKLTQFYVAQPVCSASRAALLTGCYPNRLSISGAYGPFAKKGLHPNEQTIAELLKPLGYATACFGKWHLGSEREFLPTSQGFDEYFGLAYSNDMWPYHPWQGTIFDFPDLFLFEDAEIIDTLHEQSQITTWYTEKAVDFIERKADEPFFLYVPHSMPHVPLFVSDKFQGKSSRGLYGDVIEEIDWSTGQILDALERKGLSENTLVIFTSDNGPWLSYGGRSGEAHPLREGKGTAWEGGVRVPCVMQWPSVLPRGVEIDRPAMTIDLLPTIAEITGAELPAQKIDGKSCWPLLMDPTASPHHDFYHFYYKQNELHATLSGDGAWKLYYPHRYRSLNGRTGTNDGLPIDYEQNDVETLELYNLVDDVMETNNVIGDHPSRVQEMQQAGDAIRSELGDQLTKTKGNSVRPLGTLD
ncbi:MAG: sulfatase [Saprospiraceae bacterium]|nr:sulfatase [Saprospiraceae bacterium]